jgi:L-fucose isomerase-like protein
MPCWGEEAKIIDYTPACLAYTRLFEEKGIPGACEGDSLSLTTMFILNRFFSIPVMMSNIYPFLMKEPIMKHEKINKLPEIEKPEDCLLVAHCGYLGLVPRQVSREFTVRPSVLDFFHGERIAVDSRLPEGEITLVKLHPSLNKLHIVEANLERYIQFPDSDCRNGAIVRIKDGRKFANTLYSHHYCIFFGHQQRENLDILAGILNLKIEI